MGVVGVRIYAVLSCIVACAGVIDAQAVYIGFNS